MLPDSLFQFWWVYAGLAFLMVTLVCYTLAHQMGQAIDRHDLIREARQQRLDYYASLAARRRDMNAHSDEDFNVDIVDDDEPDIAGAINPLASDAGLSAA